MLRSIVYLVLSLSCIAIFANPVVAHPDHPKITTAEVPTAIAELKGKDQKKQLSAARRLGFVINPKLYPQVIDALVSTYTDSSTANLKYQISYSLGTIGAPAAEKGRAVLHKAIEDKNPAVQAVAIRALSRTGDKSAETLQKVRSKLQSPDSNVSYRAAQYIVTLSPETFDENALIALSKLISTKIRLDEDEKVHFPADWVAADTFSDLDEALASKLLKTPTAIAATEAEFINALSHHNVKVRRAGVRGLFWIESKQVENVSKLSALIEDEDDLVKLTALRTIADMGSIAKETLPKLIDSFASSEGDVRAYTAHAIGKTGAGSKKAVDTLLLGLKDPALSVRLYSVEALGRLGSIASPAVAYLAEGVNDKKLPRNLRMAMAQALREIGTPEAQAAIEAFRQKLQKTKS